MNQSEDKCKHAPALAEQLDARDHARIGVEVARKSANEIIIVNANEHTVPDRFSIVIEFGIV